MKIYEVAARLAGSGEYVLGSKETGSHACYLIYGVLRSGEGERELRPGGGHEEMVLCISGQMRLSGDISDTLRAGQAIHLRGEESCRASNPGTGETVYVIAGGHSGGEHVH